MRLLPNLSNRNKDAEFIWRKNTDNLRKYFSLIEKQNSHQNKYII